MKDPCVIKDWLGYYHVVDLDWLDFAGRTKKIGELYAEYLHDNKIQSEYYSDLRLLEKRLRELGAERVIVYNTKTDTEHKYYVHEIKRI